jgi:hypothetical protein
MMVGSAPDSAAATMRARGLRPCVLARRLVADQHRRRAVDDARRVAGVVHMLDALDLRVALQRHRVEAHAPICSNEGLSAARPPSWCAA